VQAFKLQHHNGSIDVYTDSDWAGDLLDRKSTSSVFVFHGVHLVKHTVSSQTVIALSSGEAEFAANVKGASVGLGVKSLMVDLGGDPTMELRVHTDSSASKGICGRRGIGKVRHLHTPLLWIQQKANGKELTVNKTDGKYNVADLGTKELGRRDMDRHLVAAGFEFAKGRHPLALAAQVDAPEDGLSGYGGSGDVGGISRSATSTTACGPFGRLAVTRERDGPRAQLLRPWPRSTTTSTTRTERLSRPRRSELDGSRRHEESCRESPSASSQS
jgi:hypothetical protein